MNQYRRKSAGYRFVLFFLIVIQTACVPQNAITTVQTLPENSLMAQGDLSTLKSKMAVCGTQYMASQQQNKLLFHYQIAKHKIHYQTVDKKLYQYLQFCVGNATALPQHDSGTIEIVGE